MYTRTEREKKKNLATYEMKLSKYDSLIYIRPLYTFGDQMEYSLRATLFDKKFVHGFAINEMKFEREKAHFKVTPKNRPPVVLRIFCPSNDVGRSSCIVLQIVRRCFHRWLCLCVNNAA